MLRNALAVGTGLLVFYSVSFVRLGDWGRYSKWVSPGSLLLACILSAIIAGSLAASVSGRAQMAKRAVALTLFFLSATLTVCFLPPWWGQWAFMTHRYARIPYAFGWPPEHFSGVWRDYYDDRRIVESSYKDGKRHGVQNFYDAKGKLIRTCEWRDGEPWSGLCNFWEFKPWLAEYRDGKVWKGAMQENDEIERRWVMRYYFEGKLCSESEFRRLMGFGTNGSLIGVTCVR
ncbi:MAG TPA: hypothetical protein VL486_04780 [Verrucomicrobiae bacterium]|nr:hypothetical protein [Verrucomicrobiae bacterium]